MEGVTFSATARHGLIDLKNKSMGSAGCEVAPIG
jgi:hypothetical protein